jgi:hypothetical protein
MRTKQGRVLSTDNESDLSKANDLLDQAGELIEGVIEQATGTPVPEPDDTGSDTDASSNGGKRYIVDTDVLIDVLRLMRIQGN